MEEEPMYLDPGSGSILIQIIIGVVFAVGVGVKLFWSKIKAVFHKESDESHLTDENT